MKLRFERQAREAIRLTWGHGRYLDPWSVVHLLTGILLGILALWLSMSLFWALSTIALLAILYEAFEMVIGIIEDWQNSTLDVVLAVVGAGIAYWALASASVVMQAITFSLVGLAALALLNIGYWYYLRHRLGRF